MKVLDAQPALKIPRLVGEVEGQRMEFILRPGEYSVGAHPENAITLDVRDVSRRHALLRVDDKEVILEDLSSTNGTWVNGVRLTRAKLKEDDWIQFGSSLLVLEFISADELRLGIELDHETWAGSTCASGQGRDDSTEFQLDSALESKSLRDLDSILRGVFEGNESGASGVLHATLGVLQADMAAFFIREPDWDPLEWAVEAAAGNLGLIGNPAEVWGSGAETLVFHDIFCRSLSSPSRGVAALKRNPDRSEEMLVMVGENLGAESAAILAPLLRILSSYRQTSNMAVDINEKVQGSRLVFPPAFIRGRSRSSRNIEELLDCFSDTETPILVTGETGVGKELIVRIIHMSSRRASAAFEVVNCAAIPGDLLEAELFGIEKGVATGVERRLGKFQAADGGTLFFDEVGDMPSNLQAKLLRALQEGEIHPVGSRRPFRVDVRIVSATNSDLRKKIDDGSFRRDLFYRLAGCEIHLSPLRERPEDIPELVRHFLSLFAAEAHKIIRGVSLGALRKLQQAPWPGNIRQLEHEVRRLVSLCPSGVAIESSMLSPEIAEPPAPTAPDCTLDTFHLKTRVNLLERELVSRAVEQTKGNLAAAARILGLSRNGLVMKMKRLGLGES